MSNIMLDAPRVEIAVVLRAAHIPGCQLAPNHLSLDADEHKFGIENHAEQARPKHLPNARRRMWHHGCVRRHPIR